MGMIGNTLAQGLISGANIQDGTVDTPDLKDSAVTAAKIASAVVTPAKMDFSAGTANGIAYLNGSKVLTTGSELTFDGAKLWVSSTGEQFKLTSSGDFSTTGTGYIRWYDSVGAKGYIGYAGTASRFDLQTGPSMNFYLNAVGGNAIFAVSNSEQMRLTSTGLGIGTSSPATKLHVAGEIRSSSDISNSSNAVIYSYAGGSAGSVRSGIQMVGTSQELRLYTAGVQNATLDAAGNLGLGVTPSAWNSSFRAQDISSYGTLFSYTAGQYTGITNNAYFSNTGWLYKNSFYATMYHQGLNGQHQWFTAPSGTAGNAITFTQAMTLTSAGSLGVGETSPNKGGWDKTITLTGATNEAFELVTGTTLMGHFAAGGSSVVIGSAASVPLNFIAGNTIRASLDASGNLGIGLTPTSGYGALQVLATGSIVSAGVQRAVEIYDAGSGSGEGGAITFSSATCPAFAAVYGVSANPGGSLIFATNSANTGYPTERARIDSSGNLLVGQTSVSPTVLGVSAGVNDGANKWRLSVANSDSTNSYVGYSLYSTGAAAYRFYVGLGGTVYATSTSISAISDATLKENVRDLETGLSEVMSLKPRRFDWKNGDAQNVAGFVAQEVEQVLPELVTDYVYSKDDDGNDIIKKSLKMGDILPTLVKAIQEQQAIIESMAQRITALEAA